MVSVPTVRYLSEPQRSWRRFLYSKFTPPFEVKIFGLLGLKHLRNTEK